MSAPAPGTPDLDFSPAGAARRRLLIVVNNPAFFLSHRAPVALGAREAGWDVHVATPAEAAMQVAEITAMGLPHHPIPLSRGGRNPVAEFGTLMALARLMRRLQPDLVHLVTIKPVLWGGIAARLARVPAVAAISGLGYVFIAEGARARLLRAGLAPLYRLAIGGPARRVIFQNPADRARLEALGLRFAGRADTIRGSGADLDAFAPAPEPPGPPVVLMPARILVDKGAREFVAAARMLRAAGVPARFVLAGDPDPQNPASVPPAEIARWRAEGTVELPGHVSDMAAAMRSAHLVVLPSYREGLPKALVEAAASGRAVVTTDVPGCRDAVVPGETALLVPARDAGALAAAIRALVEDPDRRRAMGAAGRVLAEEAFCVKAVVAEHLRIYDEMTRP